MIIEDDKLHFTFKDDGQGLNLEKIRKKSVKNRLISETDRLSSKELAQMIFVSGFSTTEKTTEISGRGVGMDPVKSFIEKEGGTLEIKLLEQTGEHAEYFQPIEFHFTLPACFAAVG